MDRRSAIFLLMGVLGTVFPLRLAPASAQQPAPRMPTAENLPPYVGIHMSDITPETAQLINRDSALGFQVQETEGVLIVQVLPDTPAAAADLRQGDLIVEVEGQTITTATEVQQLIANSRVGQSLSFTLQRHSQPITISVELGVLSAT